jgi:hypothetical protein
MTWSSDRENELMILNQSYVLLAVAIVVALINFLGAGIHVFLSLKQDVDGRDRPGHDEDGDGR